MHVFSLSFSFTWSSALVCLYTCLINTMYVPILLHLIPYIIFAFERSDGTDPGCKKTIDSLAARHTKWHVCFLSPEGTQAALRAHTGLPTMAVSESNNWSSHASHAATLLQTTYTSTLIQNHQRSTFAFDVQTFYLPGSCGPDHEPFAKHISCGNPVTHEAGVSHLK